MKANSSEIVKSLTDRLTATVILDAFGSCQNLDDMKECLEHFKKEYGIEN